MGVFLFNCYKVGWAVHVVANGAAVNVGRLQGVAVALSAAPTYNRGFTTSLPVCMFSNVTRMGQASL